MRWFKDEIGGREGEEIYRRRWEYANKVPTTHGVNCTGSCRWYVYVKDGIVAWETQATEYPSNGPDLPDYEPRGCPRGASFSWYIYSPLRVKYPYVNSELLRLWREALREQKDPVEAWRSIVEDPVKSKRYKEARGTMIRSTWEEVLDIIAAALTYTIKTYGPDRIAGFSPIPAMSMVSFSSGTRFLSLIGGVVLTFYDWYADLPTASPQIWGEQTDVPESADWYNALYIIAWGTNIPMTRTPDAQFYTRARYRGAKIVAVSPDFAEYTKFADEWIAIKPGTDAALALAMGHVILKEFYAEKNVSFFTEYAKTYTDLPFLVILREKGERYVYDRFLRASDISDEPLGEWKTVVFDEKTRSLAIPNGSIGFRYDGSGRWNLELGEISPALTLISYGEPVPVEFTFFDDKYSDYKVIRNVPGIRIKTKTEEEVVVTTVLDLLFAQYGVDRGLGGDYPASYDDKKPFTPAWQEDITGVPRDKVIRIAREFAINSMESGGRSLILMGAGINHWFHSDLIYRAIIALVILTASEGRNGGGWAHYVGQEKVRTLIGLLTISTAADWVPYARLQNSTSYFYVHTDQWRYDDGRYITRSLPKESRYSDFHPIEFNVLAVRNGWLPFYPQFNVNPITTTEQAGTTDENKIKEYIKRAVREGRISLAIEDPDNPVNIPRILFVWRSNLFASGGKGSEYFMKHLLGLRSGVIAKPTEKKPKLVKWRDEEVTGKLDLLIVLDFRLSTTARYADILLPAATWYEKYDISTTDMHPFIHSFNAAIPPQWESKVEWDIFKLIAKRFSEIAGRYIGRVYDVITIPALHDTPGEISQPMGEVSGEDLLFDVKIVERDYGKIYEMYVSLGERIRLGYGAKGIRIRGEEIYEYLKRRLGLNSFGRPSLETDIKVADAILGLSPESNGLANIRSWEHIEKISRLRFGDLYARESEHITFEDTVIQPRRAYTSPTWSGIENENRRYAPFTINIERKLPWRTLTGRQHFYIDHPWFREFRESLPTYKPSPISINDLSGEGLVLRYITPHGKWQIHTTYYDNWFMLTLFRGGQVIWLSEEDAKVLGVKDNDWVEVLNENGSVVLRVVVSHRIPKGVCILYHATERTIYNPLTERGTRGHHNSLTRVMLKPTSMVGGYAQLSWAPNYYGPTGAQRDTVVIVRRVEEVRF